MRKTCSKDYYLGGIKVLTEGIPYDIQTINKYEYTVTTQFGQITFDHKYCKPSFSEFFGESVFIDRQNSINDILGTEPEEENSEFPITEYQNNTTKEINKFEKSFTKSFNEENTNYWYKLRPLVRFDVSDYYTELKYKWRVEDPDFDRDIQFIDHDKNGIQTQDENDIPDENVRILSSIGHYGQYPGMGNDLA